MVDQTYVPRAAEAEIIKLVAYFPAVAVVGPRQVGKTSLVHEIGQMFGELNN